MCLKEYTRKIRHEVLTICHIYGGYYLFVTPDCIHYFLFSGSSIYLRVFFVVDMDWAIFSRSLKLQSPYKPNFYRNMQSNLSSFLNIQYFNASHEHPPPTTTSINLPMYYRVVSFFFYMILLRKAMVVGCPLSSDKLTGERVT